MWWANNAITSTGTVATDGNCTMATTFILTAHQANNAIGSYSTIRLVVKKAAQFNVRAEHLPPPRILGKGRSDKQACSKELRT